MLNSRLKVLIVTSWYPNEINPLEGIFIQEFAHLLSKEYDVAVIAINLFNLKGLLQNKNIFKLKLKTKKQRINKNLFLIQKSLLLFIYRILSLTYGTYLRVLQYEFNQLLIHWGKPVLIHAHVAIPSGWGALQIAKKYNIPIILTEHLGPFSEHLTNPYESRLVKNTLSHVNQILAVSPSLANQIKQSVDQSLNINSIGNLIRSDFFFPKEKANIQNKIVFLSVCLLTKGKGLNYLLESIKCLSFKYSQKFIVLIGGDGVERFNLEKQVKSLNIQNNCQFLGYLSREQVRDYMQNCDVFILPSLGETFGIVLGEAMACGKPVISTYCGGSEFIVTDDTGILVAPSDSVALAEAMEKFITKKVGFNADVIRESIINRFGEKAFLQKISEIYQLVISRY